MMDSGVPRGYLSGGNGEGSSVRATAGRPSRPGKHACFLTSWAKNGIHFAKIDLLPRCEVYVDPLWPARQLDSLKGDRLASVIRHGGRILIKFLIEVRELHFLLADVANPD